MMDPQGFHWTGEHIIVSTAPTAPKARALVLRPQVPVIIDGGGTPEEARALLVRGVATLHTVEGATDEYLASVRNSMQGNPLAEFERNIRSTYERMVPISIEPRPGPGSTTSGRAGQRRSRPGSPTADSSPQLESARIVSSTAGRESTRAWPDA